MRSFGPLSFSVDTVCRNAYGIGIVQSLFTCSMHLLKLISNSFDTISGTQLCLSSRLIQLLLAIVKLALHTALFAHLQTLEPSLFFRSWLYLYPARSSTFFPRWDVIISYPSSLLDEPACDSMPEKFVTVR